MPRNTPLKPEEIESALSAMAGWNLVERTPPASDHVHTELHQVYEFGSFQDAMHFMVSASRFIQLSDHHPSWLNTYSRVEVWITTGELKHQLSANDVKLARYLNELYGQYRS